jgi:hypothetical protein
MATMTTSTAPRNVKIAEKENKERSTFLYEGKSSTSVPATV